LNPVYVDNHLLVLEKPAGVLSQADITGDDDMLTRGKLYIKKKFDKPGAVFLGLVHRLDRPASGIMVFARTSKAAARLTDQFKKKQVKKVYLALVEGRPEHTGEMEDYLLKQGGRVTTARPQVTGARHAKLSYRSVYESGGRTLVEVYPETGRAHQIRVQFSRRGFPIVGDLKYGAKTKHDGYNLALHAHTLEFEHPTLKETLVFGSPLPREWGREVCEIADGRMPKKLTARGLIGPVKS
jgi:23S rRNA pseudouridine1911/1915/1917 synthase